MHVNVLHLTDLHFRTGVSQTSRDHRYFVLNDLVSRFAELIRVPSPGGGSPWMQDALDWAPHIVAISGDIAFSGRAEEYLEAGLFLSQLQKAISTLRDGQPAEIIACPGNHDRDITYASGLVYPKCNTDADEWLCLERLQPDYPSSQMPQHRSNWEKSRAPLVVPFHNYQEFARAHKFICPAITPGLDFLVGHVQSRRFPDIEFVVLNSAWFCNHLTRADARNLWIGLPLLQRLEVERRSANSSKLRIALIHHPREWFHEEETNSYGDRPNAYRLLSRTCDVILSGHVHGSIEPPSQSLGGATVFTGGATYEGVRWRNNLSLLQFDLEEGVVSRRAFEFDPRELRWHEVLHGSANLELRRSRREVTATAATETNAVARQTSDATYDMAGRNGSEEIAILDPLVLQTEWKSTYWMEGEANGRRFTNFVKLEVDGDKVEGSISTMPAHSIDASSSFTISAAFNAGWITGVWQSDHTDPLKRRWGSLQLHAYRNTDGEPRMRGRWIGFDSKGKINVGQWRFRPAQST